MTEMAFPLVSVVTPVYNGEKYIDTCIQSVRDQSYLNWEYIVVNNCSTDRTKEIADRHASEDKRIRVVSTTTLLPLIKNHNFALKQISIKSRYCKMVHADDFLFPNCLANLVNAAEERPTTGIVGSYSLWGKKVVSDGIPHSINFMQGKELARQNLLNKIYTFWSPSSLLIRSDIIRKRDPFYNEDYLHADVMACYDILLKYDFAFVHQVLSFIRTHDESASEMITSSYSKTMLSNLDLYLRYGPLFLSSDMFQSYLSHKEKEYYWFLSESVFNFREKDFWKYHLRVCDEMGFPLKRLRLAKAVLWKILNRPIHNFKKIFKSIFKKV